MANLRSTVIVKTDICGYTVRVKKLSQSELSRLLNEHKTFISDISIRNEGSLIKGEGDSFWLVFPSVTAAAMAALEMQQELRAQQSSKSNDERLAIRVSITLGDVLHQDKDIFGDTVNLTARIESVTPQDEIYLSQAAWLALNKAEVQTSFVNEFSLKGMSEPEKVYKVDQSHKTRIIENQAIVKADLRGFIAYQESNSIKDVEYLLTNFDAFEKNIEMRKKAISAVQEIPVEGKFSRKNISALHFDQKTGFWATLIESGMKVKMGEDRIALKSARVSQVLEYMESRGLEARVIDANLSKKVLVRLRKDP